MDSINNTTASNVTDDDNTGLIILNSQTIMSLCIGTIGLLLNFFTFVMLNITEISIKDAAMVLLKSQLFFDGIAGAFLILRVFRIPLTPNIPVLYAILCVGVRQGLFLWTFFTASTYNIVAIAIQRYIITSFPFMRVTKIGAYGFAVTSYILGIALCIAYWWIEMEVRPELNICTYKYVSPMAMVMWLIAYYIIPTAALIGLYIKIISTLRKADLKIQSTKGKGSEKNIIKNAVAVAVIFIIFAAPNSIISTMVNFNSFPIELYDEFARTLTHACTMFNSVSTPIVYFMFLSAIRRKLIDIITCKSDSSKESTTSVTFTTSTC